MTPAPLPPDETTYAGRFSVRLKELRQKRGWTVPETVAAIAKEGHTVATRTYYDWESGKNQPSLEMIAALSRVFGFKSPRMMLPKN